MALRDAKAAVKRSEKGGPREIVELRAALRALIQHVEEMDKR